MNLFHAEDYVCPRRVLYRLNRANEKLRRDSVLFDLSDRVVVPQLAEGVGPKIARHHVESSRQILIYGCRCVREIAFQKPSHSCLSLEFIRSRISGCLDRESGQRLQSALDTSDCGCTTVGVDSNDRGRLNSHIDREAER